MSRIVFITLILLLWSCAGIRRTLPSNQCPVNLGDTLTLLQPDVKIWSVQGSRQKSGKFVSAEEADIEKQHLIQVVDDLIGNKVTVLRAPETNGSDAKTFQNLMNALIYKSKKYSDTLDRSYRFGHSLDSLEIDKKKLVMFLHVDIEPGREVKTYRTVSSVDVRPEFFGRKVWILFVLIDPKDGAIRGLGRFDDPFYSRNPLTVPIPTAMYYRPVRAAMYPLVRRLSRQQKQ